MRIGQHIVYCMEASGNKVLSVGDKVMNPEKWLVPLNSALNLKLLLEYCEQLSPTRTTLS